MCTEVILYIVAIVALVRDAIGLYNDVRSFSEKEKNACTSKRPTTNENEGE